MATLKPFRVLRPAPQHAADICTLPYDVMSTDEARQMAEGKPWSFLRVTRSEIEFPAGADAYSNEVYQHGAQQLRRMIEAGVMVREDQPIYMAYRLRMGSHTQTGLVAVAACAEYDSGIVKKHELTRPDKEDDRTRHIEILAAQTGNVFLTYRAEQAIDTLMAKATAAAPDIDFTAEDGIQHTAWFIRDAALVAGLEAEFAKVPALYVADGHHRSAAASRVRKAHLKPDSSGQEPWNFFLTVTFPHNQMQILGYNRAVKDLNGHSADDVLNALRKVASVELIAAADAQPRSKGEATVYLAGKWYRIHWNAEVTGAVATDPVAGLDVSILQDRVLAPVLAIGDPRTDKRISFIGGIRGTAELQRIVDNGSHAIAFTLYPTSIEDLMTIADADGLMPPKSTWFEPKLRDAMAVHLID